jgi:hypothetical protein
MHWLVRVLMLVLAIGPYCAGVSCALVVSAVEALYEAALWLQAAFYEGYHRIRPEVSE